MGCIPFTSPSIIQGFCLNMKEAKHVMPNTVPMKADRIALLDELRGFSVLCMVFYHTFYLMGAMFDLRIGWLLFDFFTPAQPFFAGCFIGISGISCRLSRSNARRGLRLLLIACGLTLVTAVLLPLFGMTGGEIYFGVLHLLSVCMLLYAALKPLLARVPPLAGILVCIAGYAATSLANPHFVSAAARLAAHSAAGDFLASYILPLFVRLPGFHSADYFPLFPHMFLFFACSFFACYAFPKWAYPSRVKPLAFLGKHSLVVYIAHQPAAYLLVFLILQIMQWVA